MALSPFQSEPSLDFAVPANRADFAAALARVRDELGRTYPLVIGGQRVETGEVIESYNPSHPAEVVGRLRSGLPSCSGPRR